jgi:hypothetical protein
MFFTFFSIEFLFLLFIFLEKKMLYIFFLFLSVRKNLKTWAEFRHFRRFLQNKITFKLQIFHSYNAKHIQNIHHVHKVKYNL